MSVAAFRLRRWAARADHPAARLARRLVRAWRVGALPCWRPLHGPLHAAWTGGRAAVANLARALWWTPLLQARLEACGPGLRLEGGLPAILGPVRIRLGRDVRLSGVTTISGRAWGAAPPLLLVGDDVDVGWRTTLAVGRRIVLGDHVRIAGSCFLAGYPGHPLDPAARAAGLPDTEDQVGDIVLEPGVWLATGVTVSAGVTIGRGTVVAAGSVVTRDLPPGVLAAGAPARVVRPLIAGERR